MGALVVNGSAADLGQALAGADRIVAFTGAGISTESGIPDYRSPNGIWAQMAPITYQQFVASEDARLEDWRRRMVMNEDFAAASPNAGHLGLARLHEMGKLSCVITQNIDGLHLRSGVPNDRVIELHGNATYGACLDCEAPMPLRAVKAWLADTGASPKCPSCGGLVKAAVISFGQSLREESLARAVASVQACDLLLVLGSSLVVEPAASLPRLAKASGATLVIVNQTATPLDPLADLLVSGGIGPAMDAALAALAG
ncbi:MAG: Sir2 family NAD-dependent protein deacetylase [Devosiaceae bacterium]|nr:Sir2 family NAD-dependent protein deacetylase [Devosiaceae bacterium MH13]